MQQFCWLSLVARKFCIDLLNQLLEEERLYLSDKSQGCPKLTDLIWLNDLQFFTDFNAIYNELNEKHQGPGQKVVTCLKTTKFLEKNIIFLQRSKN